MKRKLILEQIRMSSYKSIFIIYSLITLLSLLSLSFFTSKYLETSAVSVEDERSESILQYMRSYIEEKSRIAKNIYTGISIDNSKHQEVLYLLERGYSEYVKYKFNKLASSKDMEDLESYIKSWFSKDRDIIGIKFYPLNGNKSYIYSKSDRVVYPKENELIDIDKKSSLEPIILPSRKISYGLYENNKDTVYSFAYKVLDIYSPDTKGVLIVDFDIDSVAKAYSDIAKDYKGRFSINTLDSEPIFNTSYVDQKETEEIIKEYLDSNGTSKGKGGIQSVLSCENSKILLISVIPTESIDSIIFPSRIIVFFTSLVSILIIFLITFMITKHFSKKVEMVMAGIRKIRKGDLKHRIPVNNGKDEICEIGAGFNDLCKDLDNYINKVCLLEIEQKDAQLKALQARINPHFLYNSLEVIRMKISATGDDEAAEMIYLLAAIFRASVKEKTIVSISDELNLSEMYLEFYKIRYKDKLNVVFDIDEDINRFGIIKYTIQPIIENYMLHGFDINRNDNLLSLTTMQDNGKIHIIICDNGKGMTEEKLKEVIESLQTKGISGEGGFGLTSVNERLKLVFGGEFGLKIESQNGVGTSVSIVILSISKKEMENRVQGFYC